ncbi:unnamed protein product [Mytilus coruscus]|uniref:C1q domain-containing protein n=1 Tax=Mytilus coruscus TaxID=42192 RepID=A0A6J8B7F4_MYTCO|nr:unnamed protein product [Mytilus coruscus]
MFSLALLLIMIGYSNATQDELESQMNVKFQNMETLLREQNERIRKRLLVESITQTPPIRATAFYAHMSHNEVNAGIHRTLIFDVIKTNTNNDYSPYSGIFTVPADGVYVFTLSLRIETGTTGAFEIVKNADVQGSAIGIINSDSGHDIQLQVSKQSSFLLPKATMFL